jgi:hypothetical protein
MAMTSSDVEALNRRVLALGYEVQHVGDDFYLHRTDAPGRMYRSTRAEVEESIHQLEASDQWRLDLYGGSVDYDTTGLVVTRRDGGPPYHISKIDGHSGSNNGKTDGSGANYLYLASKERPRLGGAWHKWGGGS